MISWANGAGLISELSAILLHGTQTIEGYGLQNAYILSIPVAMALLQLLAHMVDGYRQVPGPEGGAVAVSEASFPLPGSPLVFRQMNQGRDVAGICACTQKQSAGSEQPSSPCCGIPGGPSLSGGSICRLDESIVGSSE